mgnify:FL=1
MCNNVFGGKKVMSTKVEKIETNVVELEFEISKEDFEAAMQKSYIKNVKQITIPGFRKGKAPRKMIEKMYGEAVFYDDAINFAFPKAYEEACKEGKVEPVSQPEVDVKQWPDADKTLILTAKVTVKPDVRVSKFETIDIVKPEHPVTDADVENALKGEQEKNARMITVEDRAAQNGDTVVIDYEGFVDGNAFDGGKGENHELVLGSGSFIPGFEEQLVGKNTGDETEVNVTFPEKYHAPDLEGKQATFKVKINAIKAKELPALDDDFAQDVSEFDTLEAYKNDIKEKLEKSAEAQVKRETEDAALDFVVSKMKVTIPDVMIENKIDEMVNDFGMRLSYQGMNLETYLKYTGMEMPAFRAQFKDQAEKQVKSILALESMAKREKVKATKAEIEEEYKKMAENYKLEVEKVKSYVPEEDVKKSIINNKTIDALLEKVNFVEPEAKEEKKEKKEKKEDK